MSEHVKSFIVKHGNEKVQIAHKSPEKLIERCMYNSKNTIYVLAQYFVVCLNIILFYSYIIVQSQTCLRGRIRLKSIEVLFPLKLLKNLIYAPIYLSSSKWWAAGISLCDWNNKSKQLPITMSQNFKNKFYRNFYMK
jgi:hypothetical protein